MNSNDKLLLKALDKALERSYNGLCITTVKGRLPNISFKDKEGLIQWYKEYYPEDEETIIPVSGPVLENLGNEEDNYVKQEDSLEQLIEIGKAVKEAIKLEKNWVYLTNFDDYVGTSEPDLERLLDWYRSVEELYEN